MSETLADFERLIRAICCVRHNAPVASWEKYVTLTEGYVKYTINYECGCQEVKAQPILGIETPTGEFLPSKKNPYEPEKEAMET